MLGRLDDLFLDWKDVLLPIDTALAVDGPHDCLTVAVDDEERAFDFSERSERRGLARELVVGECARAPATTEWSQPFELLRLLIRERRVARAPLEPGDPEEHSTFVQEEEESLGHLIAGGVLGEVGEAQPLVFRVQLVSEVGSSLRRGDAFCVEAEGGGQTHPVGGADRGGLVIDHARRVRVRADVLRAKANERAWRADH